MSRRTVLLSTVTALGVAGGGLLAGAGPAGAVISSYKTPVAGKWKIQDKFEYTAGGSATVGKGGTKLTALSLKPGPDNVEACGGAAPVVLAKAAQIKRFGSYKRPAVGKLNKGTGVIEPTSAKFRMGGMEQPGKISVLFEKDGRTAFTARVTVGECDLNFALRK